MSGSLAPSDRWHGSTRLSRALPWSLPRRRTPSKRDRLVGDAAGAKQVDHGGGVRRCVWPSRTDAAAPPTDLLMMSGMCALTTMVTRRVLPRGRDTRASVEDLDCPVRISNVDLLTREACVQKYVNVNVDVVIRPTRATFQSAY